MGDFQYVVEVRRRTTKMNVVDYHFYFWTEWRKSRSQNMQYDPRFFCRNNLSEEGMLLHGGRKVLICIYWRKCEKFLHRGKDSEVDAILFVAALSDYDQSPSEMKSEKDNRMIESLALFKSVLKYEGFVEKRITIMLFLSKKDIFWKKKMIPCPIVCQSEFKDNRGKDFDDGVNYYISHFRHEVSTLEHKR